MATRVPGVGLQRYTYADYAERVCRLSAALAGLGLKKGDRVGTFAWNSHRHMEVYFAAPLMGMVLHTVNIRLSAQDITYIVNHAEDRVLIVDASVWPLLEPLRKDLKTVEHFIVMKDTPGAEIPPGDLTLLINRLNDTDGAVRWISPFPSTSVLTAAAGFFDGAAYVTLESSLYRVDLDGTVTFLKDYSDLGVINFHHNIDPGKTGVLLEAESADRSLMTDENNTGPIGIRRARRGRRCDPARLSRRRRSGLPDNSTGN
jgi:acyl-CoA synthetase (AMP-forming)/AMP-acid ligase II